LLYAAGLAESGYRDCWLEAMAFDHQRKFDAGDPPYSVEAEVWRQTLALKPTTGCGKPTSTTRIAECRT
jgi:hypothetical protein